MIEQANVDQRQCFADPLGDEFIGLAGLGNPGRVIVRHDDRGGISLQRQLDDLPRMHARAVDGAAEQFLEGDQAVPVVEVQAAERLVAAIARNEPSEPSLMALRSSKSGV